MNNVAIIAVPRVLSGRATTAFCTLSLKGRGETEVRRISQRPLQSSRRTADRISIVFGA